MEVTKDADLAADLRAHWPILVTAMLGWALDAFDFTMFLFLIPRLNEVFQTGLPAMSLVVTATGLAKVVGTIGWGAVSDRFGRKFPLIISVLWFSLFSALSGLAWSYMSLLGLRILFGLGFGGEWSISAALLMESVPRRLQGIASGIMMLGFEVGYLLAALAFRVVYPVADWRWMFALGALPALLTLLIRSSVSESAAWRATRLETRKRPPLKLTPAMIQGWALLAALNFMSWAIFALYPTFLITVRHLEPSAVFPFIATYSVASIVGKPLAGRIVQHIGERSLIITYLILTIPSALLYTLIDSSVAAYAGAILMGLVPNSIFGIVPMYLARRFPVAHRGTGVGIGWAMGGVSVIAPPVIAIFTPIWGLGAAMTGFIVLGAVISMIIAAFSTERWISEPTVTSA
jgi:MFS transporter, SHS family, lactate transporter